MEVTISFSHQKKKAKDSSLKGNSQHDRQIVSTFHFTKKRQKTTEKRQKTDKIDKERNNDGQRKTESSL